MKGKVQFVAKTYKFLHLKQIHNLTYLYLTYRVSQKTWEFSDEFNIVFVMN